MKTVSLPSVIVLALCSTLVSVGIAWGMLYATVQGLRGQLDTTLAGITHLEQKVDMHQAKLIDVATSVAVLMDARERINTRAANER